MSRCLLLITRYRSPSAIPEVAAALGTLFPARNAAVLRAALAEPPVRLSHDCDEEVAWALAGVLQKLGAITQISSRPIFEQAERSEGSDYVTATQEVPVPDLAAPPPPPDSYSLRSPSDNVLRTHPGRRRREVRSPSLNDLRSPSRGDLRSPSLNDLRAPSRTDLRTPSRPELRSSRPDLPRLDPRGSRTDLRTLRRGVPGKETRPSPSLAELRALSHDDMPARDNRPTEANARRRGLRTTTRNERARRVDGKTSDSALTPLATLDSHERVEAVRSQEIGVRSDNALRKDALRARRRAEASRARLAALRLEKARSERLRQRAARDRSSAGGASVETEYSRPATSGTGSGSSGELRKLRPSSARARRGDSRGGNRNSTKPPWEE